MLIVDRLSPRCTELFVNAPHESISYIWQVFGCRHSLEPTDNDFEAPSIPALTLAGFVRWESIQVLLAPDEHVPFILAAVESWDLKNPGTGEPFPKDLTASSFPSEPDEEITAWHEACGDKLRQEATPRESPRPAFPSAADRVNAAFSHVPAGSRGASDYFNHRSVPFSHVNAADAGRYARGGTQRVRISPDRVDPMRYAAFSPSERARRRSFSDYPSPHSPHAATHLDPTRPTATRRHSHPRRFSTDDSESDDDIDPRDVRHGPGHPGPHRSPKIIPRYVSVPSGGPVGGTPPSVSGPAGAAIHSTRAEGGAKLRQDGHMSPNTAGARKKSAAGFERAKNWASEKLSDIFPGASPLDRPRRSPGSSSGNVAAGGGGGGSSSRDSLRLGRSRSYDDGASDSDPERERERERRRRAARRRAERDYEREREQQQPQARPSRRSRDDLPDWEDAARERDRERPRSRKDREREARYLRRPENPRRTSSHADVDRLDRDRHRYDVDPRDRYVDDRQRRRGMPPLDERDRTASPGIKGVGGRRYPTEQPWTQESP